ncbi:MAG: hypothetical protein R3B36_00875 [Polyangiaceae bacterium]
MRRVLVLLALASVCACGLISGASDLRIVDDGADGAADAGAAGETGAGTQVDAGPFTPPAPTCDAPAKCMTAPAGWDGPFAVLLSGLDGRGLLQCPPAFTRGWERTGSTADASAPPATCTCACGALSGSCAVTMNDHDDDKCVEAPDKRVLNVGACVPTAGGADSWRATAAVVSAGCAPDASVSVTPLGGDGGVLGCVPATPEGCGAGACVPPAPKGTRICVRPPDGDPSGACPPEYADAVKLASGVEDSRGCTACSCPATPGCSFTYGLYEKENCLGNQSTIVSDSNCYAPGANGIKLLTASVTGSCAPAGGKPTGTVKTTGDTFLCCVP